MTDGAVSVLKGDYRAIKYLARSFGLLGANEFNAANLEGQILDTLTVEAANHPELVLQALEQTPKYVAENANAYNVSRVIGRTATGFVLAPLGALAAVGDFAYGVEQGNVTLQEHLNSVVYGND